ncbi:putative wall-associated receptor kinase-like 16 [Cornus florida]|uniref:putative wall-associated receptor kinase-like 16 n=1 Tax=Cornus florida TaxID=4283 RepID=UPI002897EECA|nr:putative wall-associated receptor kinase-like 16 [Cornus florida]
MGRRSLSVLAVAVVGFEPFFLYCLQACMLNFTSFPYQPSGECIGSQETINKWGSFPTTLCCQNALTVLSKALAQQARIGDGHIFLDEAHWRNCSGSFTRQHSVSVQSCGFYDLFHGSSKCSSISLSKFKHNQTYQDASNECNQLKYSSFDEACRGCANAVVKETDVLLKEFKGIGNDREKGICGLAVVVSVAAGILDDHPLLMDFYSCLSSLDVLEPGYIKIKFSVAKTILASLAASIGLMLIVLLTKCVKNKHGSEFLVTKKSTKVVTWPDLYIFSKAEIEKAINFVNEREIIGRGNAGIVYKGILPSGQVVAIKEIRSTVSDSFLVEGETLSRVRHLNLVSPLGYCMEEDYMYLVYEYCSAGNLAQHLLRKDTVLTWERRVKILRDCACALKYLHNYIDGSIVHRDIKLTSILLTESMEAKLTGFGLAKMMGMDENKLFTEIWGTIGYLDPEYMGTAMLTCASDIYNFGIVALQLLSGQKVFELDVDASDQLARKAKDVTLGKRPLRDIRDRQLNGDFNVVDFGCILDIAVLCVSRSSADRPTIDVVFEEMEEAWNNTLADMRAKRAMNSSETPQSRSFQIIAL